MAVRAYFRGFPASFPGEKVTFGNDNGNAYVTYPDWRLMNPSDAVVGNAHEWTLFETFSSKDGHKFPTGLWRASYTVKHHNPTFYELQISAKNTGDGEVVYEVRCRSGYWYILQYVVNDLIYGKYPAVSLLVAFGILFKAFGKAAKDSSKWLKDQAEDVKIRLTQAF